MENIKKETVQNEQSEVTIIWDKYQWNTIYQQIV